MLCSFSRLTYYSTRAGLRVLTDTIAHITARFSDDFQSVSRIVSFQDHGVVFGRNDKQSVFIEALRPEKLHDLNPAIDGELLDRTKTFWSHGEDFNVVDFGQDQIEIRWRCEIALKR